LSHGEPRPEEVLELTAPLTSENATEGVPLKSEEIGDAAIRGVVQVGYARERRWRVGEDGREIKHVVAVVPYLKRRVRDWVLAVLLDSDEGVAVLELFGVTPLFELDDEV
jgi:hypothetical protein